MCILSLLIERLLEQRLKQNPGLLLTADAAFSEVSSVHVNHLRVNNQDCLIRTRASEKVIDILKTLKMEHLLEQFEEKAKLSE